MLLSVKCMGPRPPHWEHVRNADTQAHSRPAESESASHTDPLGDLNTQAQRVRSLSFNQERVIMSPEVQSSFIDATKELYYEAEKELPSKILCMCIGFHGCSNEEERK